MNSFLTRMKSQTLILVILPIVLIPLIYLDATLSMINVWRVNETFTHGFLVFPLVFWLIWQRKNYLQQVKSDPEPRVFALLVPAIFCWIIGAAVDVQIVQQFSMISIIIITVWLVIGWRGFSVILFPLIFLFFAVPFGQSLIPPLMNLTANFTVQLVQLSGIPVYQDGLSFTLPTGSWSVVDECSGVRYLIASFSLGSIYAYLTYSSFHKRMIFIVLSLIVPVVGNILRAYGIVLIGHLSGMQLATGVDHLVYGWVFFGILIFLLFFIGSFWRDPDSSFAPNIDLNKQKHENKYGPYAFLILLIAIILIIFSGYFVSYIKNTDRQFKQVDLNLPENFAAWQFNQDRNLNWSPIFTNPDVESSRGYVFADDLVQLNVAYYQHQRQGAEAISTNNRIVSQTGGDWKKVRSAVIKEDKAYIAETQIRNLNTDILVWHWYKIGEFITPDPYIAKALDAYNLIIKGRTDAAMITLSTRVNTDINASRKNLRDFWLESNTKLNDVFEQLIKKEKDNL